MNRTIRQWGAKATTQRKVHGWLTFLWLGLAVPGVVYWKNSIPFLVFVSIYANVAGHWSSWQATKVEVKQDEDRNTQEEMPTLP